MKTIEELRVDLLESGFCTFNLKDYDLEYYNYLKNNVLKDDGTSDNLKRYYDRLKIDFRSINAKEWLDGYFEENRDSIRSIDINYSGVLSENVQCNILFKSFEDANNFKYFVLSHKILELKQIWFSTESPALVKSDVIKSMNESLLKKIYDLDSTVELDNNINVTFFDNKCMIGAHRDGADEGRLCAILIYLNTSYNKEDGGFLRLNREVEITPELGNVAILDFTKNDILHEVVENTSEYGRYAILDFLNFRN